MSRRSSHRHSEGASKRLDSTVAAEQEDVLAELLGLLTGGSSHWYTLNGDPFAKTSLCKMLGFYNESDYHAFLVSKKLAAYRLDKKSRKMIVEILIDNWTTYLPNSRYHLFIPTNCEIECKIFDLASVLLCKKQEPASRTRHYVIRLGRRCSETYSSSITKQQIWLPKIPGWSSKQRYFRRLTNEVVLNTILDHKEVYQDKLDELDTKISNLSANLKLHRQPSSPSPKRLRTVISAVAPILEKVVQPFRGLFPFTNAKLHREVDFNLHVSTEHAEVDSYLTDFVAMKQRHSKNDKVLQYVDRRNGMTQCYVKIPSPTTDKSFSAHSKWIDPLLRFLSRQDNDKPAATRRLTKALVRRDKSSVVTGLEELGMKPVTPLSSVAESAMWKDAGVTSRSARRVLRRHLRYHSGHTLFEPERQVASVMNPDTNVKHALKGL